MSLALTVLKTPSRRPAQQSVPITKIPKKHSGYVIYEGPSMIDGKPIVVVATGFNKSKNVKTGSLIQTWILRSDVDPIHAMWQGADASVCGNCKHRTNTEHNPDGMSTCYVNIVQAPLAVWRAYKAGSYLRADIADLQHLKGRYLRLGAYGDPAAIPFEVLEKLTGLAERHTGYTHGWTYCDQRLRSLVMASCDTPEEAARAHAKGWRTFRVRLADEPVQHNERICPASEEGGKKVTCSECMACHGTGSDGPNTRANIAIIVHGSTWKPVRFAKVRRLQRQKKGWKHLVQIQSTSIKQREIDTPKGKDSRHRRKS